MAPSLCKETNFLRDREEILERAAADIDDFCTLVLGYQPFEKCHLAANVVDVGKRRELRQIVRQLRPFVGQVECGYGPIINDVILCEQSRNQSLSAAPMGGANHVERSGFAAHTKIPSAQSPASFLSGIDPLTTY